MGWHEAAVGTEGQEEREEATLMCFYVFEWAADGDGHISLTYGNTYTIIYYSNWLQFQEWPGFYNCWILTRKMVTREFTWKSLCLYLFFFINNSTGTHSSFVIERYYVARVCVVEFPPLRMMSVIRNGPSNMHKHPTSSQNRTHAPVTLAAPRTQFPQGQSAAFRGCTCCSQAGRVNDSVWSYS